jgi:hypothetical protein
LRDALAEAGLDDLLSFSSEVKIINEKADMWVLRSRDGVPVGGVKVTGPGKLIMDSENLHGQIYQYMKRVQSFFGLKCVFVIISTYQQWRVYWLPAADEIARAKTLPDPEEWQAPDQTNGQLYASQVYNYNDEDLPRVLVSVILKMRESLKYGMLPEGVRPRIVINSRKWVWASEREIVLKEDEMPKDDERIPFYLLHDLGAGADGQVWKACSESGLVCAIKFAHPRHPNETVEARQNRLEAERRVWKTVWGEKRKLASPRSYTNPHSSCRLSRSCQMLRST